MKRMPVLMVAVWMVLAPIVPQAHAMDMDGSAAPGNSLKALKAEPMKADDGLVHLNNKVCPISGEEAGKDTYAHEGVVYNLCCAMCGGKFKNNPSKYAIPSEEIQTVLAGVMG